MKLRSNFGLKQLGMPVIWLYLLMLQLFMHLSLCFSMTIKLYDLLRRGTKTWIVVLSKLMSFTILLAPGWYKLVNYWVFDEHVIKNIPYSNNKPTSRNYLDIYLPLGSKNETITLKKYPVIIFVSGGAWIIGYKMWSALIARGLSRLGSIVICPDYRNAPQGDIECMMDDIANSIKWTIDNISKYNGDNKNIIVAGQSAGAHICMCLLIDSYYRINSNNGIISPIEISPKSSVFHNYYHKSINDNDTLTSSLPRNRLSPEDLSCVSLLIGVSGPYNLHSLGHHLHDRGLDNSILNWICHNDINKYSPTLQIRQINNKITSQLPNLPSNQIFVTQIPDYFEKFPKVVLYHGSDDCTVPCSNSVELAEELRKGGADVDITIYDGYSHTDPILEGPLMGENRLLHDIMKVIRKGNNIHTSNDHDIDKPLVPRWLVQTAKRINPF